MSHNSVLPKARCRMAASIEATPRQVLETDHLEGLFPPQTRVYLTDVGTTTPADLIAAARRLRLAGYTPVPHVAARRIMSHAELADRLSRLTGEAGVDDLLVIAGSVETPAGPFASSMDLLRTGILARHGITRIGVAGHPEGSPDIPTDEVAAALAWKAAHAAQHGIEMRIVTQFGFDAERYVAWADGLRAAGITLPVHVGVSGPARITTLLKYAALCGVGPSLDFLKKRAGSVMALAAGYSPEGLVQSIEAHVSAHPDCAITQIHVFPFGGLRKSAEWLAERGSWFSEAVAIDDTGHWLEA
ncbi:methylenetetrahydrofolate reductase (NADPH) [Tepidamorphus gemmatus]|uniref:Methylenetetrahydrofolate reductase n=2 Tax=Tepidamorphus gemmatus TaxID=747076 RepID=A0A4R3M6U1_9HYPH|nr:methylenetetrahydrofolate reductase (NADPH) [Tepidamorphus gemmatus]